MKLKIAKHNYRIKSLTKISNFFLFQNCFLLQNRNYLTSVTSLSLHTPTLIHNVLFLFVCSTRQQFLLGDCPKKHN